jgi:protoporphyrinogen oxidase
VTSSEKRPAETRVEFAILGAGPTGIGAAWRLWQANSALPFLLLDESLVPGGRAASFTTPEGFTFDYGGHVLFPHSEYTEFAGLLDQVIPQWHHSVPIRGVWVAGRFIPTPVQRNIHRLPVATMAACLWGLWRRPVIPTAAEPNLHEYLCAHFGEPLTRHVMGPLNRKMWAHSPEAMSSAWSSHRSGSKEVNIPDVSIRNVLRNFVLNRDDPNWMSTTAVRYPMTGGVGMIWERIFGSIPQAFRRVGIRVVEVDTRQKRLHLSDGSMVRYERLVSSIPLDVLLRLTDQPELQAKADRFRAAQVQLFGFGLRGLMPAALKNVHALSIPSADIPFWRLNVPSNFSPGNVPQNADAWSILCESSIPPGSRVRYRQDQIETTLRQMGFIPPGTKVVSLFTSELEHGYPVPFAGSDPLLNEVQARLEQLDIYSRGRFGGWRYEVSNQDHAFMQGVEVIDRLREGKPEYTYRKTW